MPSPSLMLRSSSPLPGEPVVCIEHPSFLEADATCQYDDLGTSAFDEYAATHLPDEVTRDFARRMHFAGYRYQQAIESDESAYWLERYHAWRDRIVLGNLKLVYRVVRRWRVQPHVVDDCISDCQIVLIQAVARYDPWIGIRFSTYAFTCLMRAMSRLVQRRGADQLTRAVPLEVVAAGEPRELADGRPIPGEGARLDEYFDAAHPLLSDREKFILARRFYPKDSQGEMTLEQVGRELGVSKERVRQLQESGLSKLRSVLLGSAQAS